LTDSCGWAWRWLGPQSPNACFDIRVGARLGDDIVSGIDQFSYIQGCEFRPVVAHLDFSGNVKEHRGIAFAEEIEGLFAGTTLICIVSLREP
jgi:hypothetical protein